MRDALCTAHHNPTEPAISTPQTYERQLQEISAALQDKLRLRAAPFDRLVARAKSRLPARVHRSALALVEAGPYLEHPRLRHTLDFAALERSGDQVLAHLGTIDLADQRKGRILSILGALSLNLIAVVALVVGVLIWRGYL